MDRETVEEIKRHFGVVAEDLRGDVRIVAEGQVALRDEFLRDLGALRREMQDQFQETKALVRLSYAEIDKRVRELESSVVELPGRLERLKGRAQP